MKINGIFEYISLASVLLFISFVTIIDANPMRNECDTDSDCYSHLTCSNHNCIDPCQNLSQGRRATCTVNNHMIDWICNAGFEYPKRSSYKICLPIEWSCYVDKENPDDLIKCLYNPDWYCVKNSDTMTCRTSKTINEDFNEESSEESSEEFDDESYDEWE